MQVYRTPVFMQKYREEMPFKTTFISQFKKKD